jgi:hypothetical protein
VQNSNRAFFKPIGLTNSARLICKSLHLNIWFRLFFQFLLSMLRRKYESFEIMKNQIIIFWTNWANFFFFHIKNGKIFGLFIWARLAPCKLYIVSLLVYTRYIFLSIYYHQQTFYLKLKTHWMKQNHHKAKHHTNLRNNGNILLPLFSFIRQICMNFCFIVVCGGFTLFSVLLV